MKTVSKLLLLSSLITISTSYTMDNTIENKTQQSQTDEEIFQTLMGYLNEPIADFINDFKTWPKEEQDKITTYYYSNSIGYFIDSKNGKPAASHKYNGSIGSYLDCRLTQQQIEPFLFLIDHIKQQQPK
jgi:hypothetical protein